MGAGVRLIIGLGNPEDRYLKTRHNAGVWFVERLAAQAGVSFQSTKYHGRLATVNRSGQRLLLFVPNTFMNESGKAVQAIAHFYQVPPDALMIAHDELSFEPGEARLKLGGGHAGHNGLRDIIRALGTGEFWRLRIGISHPGDKSRVSGYVLSNPSLAERQQIDDSIETALAVVDDMVHAEFDRAVRTLHEEK